MILNTIKNLKLLKSSPLFGAGIPKEAFAVYTSQAATLGRHPKRETYTREGLKLKNESPTPEEIQRMEEEKYIKEREQQAFEHKTNDRNSNNYVKVKVNLLQKLVAQPQTIQPDAPLEPLQPYTLLVHPRAAKVTFRGLRRKVPCSLKKVIPYMKLIIGMHIYDAIATLQNSNKKAAKYVLRTLQQVRRHGLMKHYDEERFYVVEATSGKHKRVVRLRYHAKHRMGFMFRDTSQLAIKLEERPVEYMYKQMLVGKVPIVLADLWRKSMVKQDVDFDRIRKNTWLLTAKGRQQKHLMLKRQCLTKYYEFKKQGVKVPMKLIMKDILEKEAKEFGERYRQTKLDEIKNALGARQQLFNKNEELSK
jgi:ribosomal protein L22